ncbi:MFS transporter [Mycetocola zhujimingii]|uniref:MFS transporter n=1 Tax=Mycetocola zhujimingii TaxID=2079792 RepID=UPI0013C40881|nr:MFS transporter [Mycetocola zhujimingii]
MSAAPPSNAPSLPDTTPIPTGGIRRRDGRWFASITQDPVLRRLVLATLVSTLGRGVFLTLTVLYFTLIVELPAMEVALLLTISSAIGVGTSYLGGHLADRFSARRLAVWLTLIEAVALACYPLATSFPVALAVACVVTATASAAHSTRGAIIARAFTGQGRVGARAVLRTVTNIGISLGSAAGGIALLLATPTAYRSVMVIAAVLTGASAFVLARLPKSVDAPQHDPTSDVPRPERGRSPFRNPTYLALTVLSGVFGMQFGVAEVGLPLWIVHDTRAPSAVYSVLLILNTILVIAFQVRLSRGTHDVAHAGKISVLAGILMVVACGLYAGSADVAIGVAIALLVLAMVVHSFAEILSSASNWGLSFELADQSRAGAYQGVFAMGYSLGAMAAPLVISATVLTHGTMGWMVLGAVFLLSALGINLLARHHLTTAPRASAP